MRNRYEEHKIARSLKRKVQTETMWAAREHMLERGHVSWSIPEGHDVVSGKSKRELVGMSRIWFSVVKQS